MSYVFFQDVLEALGKKINYESISNMYGKTVFDKKGGDAINNMIAKANPLTKPSKTNSAAMMLSMPGQITIIESGEQQKAKAQQTLGDIDWFADMLK